MDLEIPANHLFERVIRVDRLMERLDVQAPEIGGWLHKEVKKRTQHLEKHHVAEFSIGEQLRAMIKLRLKPDGTGPGFDVLFSKEAPRVRLARAEQADGAGEPPFEVERRRRQEVARPAGQAGGGGAGAGHHRRRLVEAKIDGEAMRTHPKQTVLAERSDREHGAGGAGDRLAFAVAQRAGAAAPAAGDRREEIFLSKGELKTEDRTAAGLCPGAVRSAVGDVGAGGAGGFAGQGGGPDNGHSTGASATHSQTIRYRQGTPSIGTPPIGTPPPGTPPLGTPPLNTSTHAPSSVAKPPADPPKPALDTPAGDLVRRTLIGATVESAVQNAAATSSPPSAQASPPAATAAPPTEGVSKTPLANPSHVETLRKEAAGTIDAKKQNGSLAKS